MQLFSTLFVFFSGYFRYIVCVCILFLIGQCYSKLSSDFYSL